MKPSHAANAALALAAIGWVLAFYGALSQLGDPYPHLSPSVVEAAVQKSRVILLGGIIALLVALWLSGYSFAQAKWRSMVAALCCFLPAILIYANTFLRHIASNPSINPTAQSCALGSLRFAPASGYLQR